MKSPAKVSVIIPVYNVAEYLPFALQSCLDQTLYDVEFICINDGSTDNSLDILREYESKDERFIVIDKKNGGVSSARNEGLKVATGKWIMFLDPDDYLAKNACERVWIEGEEGPCHIINFGTEIVPKQPKATPWHYYALSVPTRRFYEFTPYVLFGEPSAKPFIWHQAYLKELLDKNGISFDEELKLGEDQTFLISVYPCASKFSFIEDKLYNYRFVRNNSAMQVLRKDPLKKLKQHILVVDKVFAFWQGKGFLEKYPVDLLSWAVEFITIDLVNDELEKDAVCALATKLCGLIEKYGLNSSIKNLDKTGKSYYKSLVKMMKG